MIEQRALGATGGARGVLDHAGLARHHGGQGAVWIPASSELREVLEIYDGGYVQGFGGDDFLDRGTHGEPAEFGLMEHPTGARLAQHIGELGSPISGVDGDHHQACQRQTEL